MAEGKQDEKEEKQVNFKVRKSTKEDWKEFVDENKGEYQSLTQFFIKAANREMSGQHEPPPDPTATAGPTEVDIDLDPVHGRLDDIETQLGALVNEFRELEISTGGTDDTEMLNLMGEVQDLLPLVESEEEFYEMLEQDLSIALPHGERARVSGEVDDIRLALDSEDWDVTVTEIREACSRLARQPNNVQSTLVDGERHYYELRGEGSETRA